jgi:hypothetical protein
MIEFGQISDNLLTPALSYSPKMLINMVEPMGVEPTTSRVRF